MTPARHFAAANAVMLALAAAFGLWLAIDSMRPAPLCAVPIPETTIKSEVRT